MCTTTRAPSRMKKNEKNVYNHIYTKRKKRREEDKEALPKNKAKHVWLVMRRSKKQKQKQKKVDNSNSAVRKM